MVRFQLFAATIVFVAVGAYWKPPRATSPNGGADEGSTSSAPQGSDAVDGEASAYSEGSDLVLQPGEPVLVHSFGEQTLPGGGEIERCAQWSLHNHEPLYVNTVTFANDGAYHHSNWLIVPETIFVGEDGFFECGGRGYSELTAAIQGTVLFAQSTQSREEVQDLADGVVIKIPPNSKVIGKLHLLNLSTQEKVTGARMRLDLVHPADVKVVVTPFRLAYYDLHIAPNGESRFASECDIGGPYEAFTDRPLDMKLHWVLPHYHGLGNYFRLDVVGGPMDGQNLFEIEGFNAGANGQPFSPPIDLTGATGLRFSCGFNNPRDVEVGWGIGDQEMCVMLGLVEGDALFDAAVNGNDMVVGTDADGRELHNGPCRVTMLPKNERQTMPTQAEIAAPFYVPESDEDSGTTTVVPECTDSPEDEPAKFAPTLSTIRGSVFTPSCTFSSCHDAINPPFGLDLETELGLRDRLLNHDVQHATSMPLLTPGDAQNSWLYHMVSDCQPMSDTGAVVPMPRNAPELLEPGLVATVRQWIDDGAEDN